MNGAAKASEISAPLTARPTVPDLVLLRAEATVATLEHIVPPTRISGLPLRPLLITARRVTARDQRRDKEQRKYLGHLYLSRGIKHTYAQRFKKSVCRRADFWGRRGFRWADW